MCYMIHLPKISYCDEVMLQSDVESVPVAERNSNRSDKTGKRRENTWKRLR